MDVDLLIHPSYLKERIVVVSKLKWMVSLPTVVLFLLLSTGCVQSADSKNRVETSPPNKIEVTEVASPTVTSLAKLEGNLAFLTFERSYTVTSEFDDFGEEVNFISNKVNENFGVAKGSYSSGVLFYRIYHIDLNQVQIVYEITNEKWSEFEHFEKSENVFEFKSKKPITLLEKPYEVGHSWEDGSITAIYEIEGEYFIEVTYKNYNKIIFSNQKGVKEIHYTLPPELQRIYAGITDGLIIGK
jgi:hypothetical protein